MNQLSYEKVMIVMGSQSDWATMKNACDPLTQLNIRYGCAVVSAHRTPQRLYQFASEALEKGTQIIIAGAGGAAHLPGMVAALTPLPVIAVPVRSKFNDGLDSLLSIAQMPRGVAVATQAVGEAGAFNAGLMAAQILALGDSELQSRVIDWRASQSASVPEEVE